MSPLADWQLWAVALGSGLVTMLLRLGPVLLLNGAPLEARVRRLLDLAGFAILGGLVGLAAWNAAAPGADALVGVAAALAVTIALAAWRGWTLLAALAGMGVFLAITGV